MEQMKELLTSLQKVDGTQTKEQIVQQLVDAVVAKMKEVGSKPIGKIQLN